MEIYEEGKEAWPEAKYTQAELVAYISLPHSFEINYNTFAEYKDFTMWE